MNETLSPLQQGRWKTVLIWIVLFAMAAFVGYQQIFSTFAEYDDEGYVMISLRSFMNGQPLYDETFSQYGPAFYLVEGSIQRLLDLPITHNVVRLKTIAKWLLVAAACAFFVGRLTRDSGTRSRPLSMLTFCIVFLHLDRLCLEPGHPQELCALGVMAAVLCSLGISSMAWKTRLAGSVILGVVCATLLLTKLNVGLFLTAAAISGLVVLLPPTRLKTYLLLCVYGGVAALPLMLYRNHLLEIHSGLLAGITAIGGVSLVYLAQKSRISKDLSLIHI